MSCGNFSPSGVQSGHCVADVVRRIVKAQHQAVEAEEDTCLTSCERSIEDLLTEFEPNRRRLRHNTIPFILYCKENCKPFIGSGVIRRSNRSPFKCIESPIFRVKNFVKGSDSCVLLEILKPVHTQPGQAPSSDGKSVGSGGSGCSEPSCSGCGSVCGFFHGHHIDQFQATGICITVDLNCFCGITCLDPITPLRAPQRVTN